MATGTDGQLLKKSDSLVERVQGKGRPKANRDLGKRLLQAGYSTKQIAETLKCTIKTVYILRNELIASGELKQPEIDDAATPLIEADFDQECIRATSRSFKGWLQGKRKKPVPIFNFCLRVWDQVWEKPSLVMVRDRDDPLGDQLCDKFNAYFKDDVLRMRTRKKLIRQLFTFLGRDDLNHKNLTMSNARDPRQIKRVPQIEMPDFPLKLEAAINELTPEQQLTMRFKLSTQIRTGSKKEERGLLGLRKGIGQSYLIMESPEVYRCHVVEKMREEWDISQLSAEVRKELFQLYQKTEQGDFVFKFTSTLNRAWTKATLKHIGVGFTLHDVRKVSVTWYYACGLPLEIATMINVGWKDLNTPKDHYLQLRNLLKKTQKREYEAKIPSWFKDGLTEYMEE